MFKTGDLLYDIPTPVIALVLLGAMLAFMALAYFFGARQRGEEDTESRSLTTAVQGSMLGLLALLMGFTFSLGLGRHDTRAEAVVTEANAIGTAWLRADFLPEELQQAAKAQLEQYLAFRVEAGLISADQQQERQQLVESANEAFVALWEIAASHVQAERSPAAVSFASALNDMIDALGERDAAIERHVPEIVVFMLFATFLLSGAVLGYTSGLAGTAPSAPVYVMLVLIVMLVFMIVDLDRPRRGLIAVDQSPMTSLLEGIRAR